jgi:hypothetical protein
MIPVTVFAKKTDVGFEIVIQFDKNINTIVEVANIDDAIKAVKALASTFGDLRQLEDNIRNWK